jgi:hypothetical protein
MLRKANLIAFPFLSAAAVSLAPLLLAAQVAGGQCNSSQAPIPTTIADSPAGAMSVMPGMRAVDTGRAQAVGMASKTGMAPGPLGIPMTRMGPGTSWLPDASTMRAQPVQIGGWELMIQGLAFVTYDDQLGGPRSATQFGSQNWGMLMASHSLGAGRLELRDMMSAEAATVTAQGYPLLLQSGEEYDGASLHDRQHPHNLFMETAAEYATPLTHTLGLELYGGPAGDPALGPAAFPHRPSAASDPFAPLGHHWQDATHISFGVLTAGLFTRTVQLETSIFNGREPDQDRTDFDLATPHYPTLDSYSARLTVNAAPQWSVATWYGFLRSPEQLTPTVSEHRMGASLLNAEPFGTSGQWSSALIYGANLYSNDRRLSNSVLAETNLDLDGHNTLFGRVEFVTKSPEDLDVPVPAPPASNRFNVGSLTIGYVREIGAFTRYGAAGLGALVMLDAIPSTLEPAYHTVTPGGFAIFLRLRPAHVHHGPSNVMDHEMGM